MDFHSINKGVSLSYFQVDEANGLSSSKALKNLKTYGKNTLISSKKTGFLKALFNALKEPMMLILIFSFILAFGTGIGKYFKTGEADFAESIGILFAVVLSVSVTLIMEGSSERAFIALKKLHQEALVKVFRDGKKIFVKNEEVVPGDIIFVESGDKIVADGRIIESDSFYVDESALTGESEPVLKNENVVLEKGTPVFERVNSVFSGTFVSSGSAKILVIATGEKTEMGALAGELKKKKELDSPLQQKLSKLGKTVTIIGCLVSLLVFIASIIRCYFTTGLDFNIIREHFISSVILIVAAVPEGLPTIVAVSLALNMIKLAKENALIKKMVATETAGAVSVICSDKTGTLTLNQMRVEEIHSFNGRKIEFSRLPKELLSNFILNGTAELINGEKGIVRMGNATECALLQAVLNSNKNFDYKSFRKEFKIQIITPFSSENKYMISLSKDIDGKETTYIKGAPEKVLKLCNLTEQEKNKISFDMQKYQLKACRVICFGHKTEGERFTYDGFVSILDPIRPDVLKAVETCKKAGIKVKILTGDNPFTALSVARQIGIDKGEDSVVTGDYVEGLSEEELIKVIDKITVIARSTPLVKLKVVKCLKKKGEVVAVTGDGINDAPAIKQADVGIVMGITGSDITKEAADVILLDDSFATLVNAIKFGRSVYKNLQRFIVFQLSVNVSALLIVTICALCSVKAPFTTLEMLWINLIMDGPPALTLGLTKPGKDLMTEKPVLRENSIINSKMLGKIIFNGVFTGSIVLLQVFTDFLGVGKEKNSLAVFTLFVVFQLFNAFNSIELGSESIFKGIKKNKIMAITFFLAFILQIIIVAFSGGLPIIVWIKIILTGVSVVVLSECYKFIYKNIFHYKKTNKFKSNKNSARA